MTLDMHTCILLSMAEHTYVVLHHATDPMLADLEVRFVSYPFVFYFCKRTVFSSVSSSRFIVAVKAGAIGLVNRDQDRQANLCTPPEERPNER